MSQTHPRLAQSIWASVLNGPDPTVDPIRWNSVWERRIKDDSLTRCAIELMISGYGDQAETLLTLIRYNTRFLVEMQHILTSSYRGDGFNQKWKATTTSERRKHMLEGLVRSTIINPDTEADRVFCSDITLDALDKEDGEPFIKLVEAYVAPDVSKLMTETVRSYPHPKWGDELKMEHERDKTSMKSLALDMLQSKRDLYICRFIDGTLESFIDVPRRPIQVVETKPRSRKRNKFRKEASEKLKDFERIIGKDILKEVTKRWMNDRSDTVRACEFCCKLEDPAHLLKRCQRCLSSVQRKIHYCSPDCQRSDWSVHKKICGKLLTTETVKSISILPPINERFKLSPPKLPHTYGFRFGLPLEGITRSPALEKQVDLLNDPANEDVDYFFFSSTGKRYPINIAPKSRMHRTVFEDARYAAFMKHDRYYTLQLINHLVSRGVQLSGATDLTEQDIQDQLQAEFPWFLVSMYATGFETIERISNGRTTLEKQGDEMQETYEMQLANPELLENERAKWRAKWDSDGTSDIMKRAARSSAHGKMVDADKVRKILTDLIGNDNGLGVVDRMMREMGYR